MLKLLSRSFVVFAGLLTVISGDIEYAQHGNAQTPPSGRQEVHYGASQGHNVEFDHEAILGSQQANLEYGKLPPHEAKRRLGVLLQKMDLNKDKKISKDELTTWIFNNFKKQEEGYAAAKLIEVDLDRDNKVGWSEYLSRIYGYTMEEMASFENDTTPEMQTFVDMVNDDKEKFRLADRDKSGQLTVKEYAAFLYPHSHTYMQDHEVMRTLKEMDKDGDGMVSFDEYLGKSKPSEAQLIVDRENFDSFDTNKDGKLDKNEIKNWVLPDQKGIASDEAKHLISETDINKDGLLTYDEIIDRHDLWVGSAATDYGDSLVYQHEEL